MFGDEEYYFGFVGCFQRGFIINSGSYLVVNLADLRDVAVVNFFVISDLLSIN